ncbi:MAG TPA: hypothetical protein VFE62_15405 [Gemmataceae bacterium]|nr:hypothetical protein [Gemmataceae bacterium]
MRRYLPIWLLVPLTGFLLHSHAQTPMAAPKARTADKLPEAAQPIFFSGFRAMEWLKLTNKPDGRFVYGFQPSLRVPLDGDNFPSQAGATFALARASRYYRDGRGAAISRQAALTLIGLETMVDPQDATLRYTAAPPTAVERLSSNGYLISAIHELPDADKSKDLLDQAEQLCTYLRQQQQSDGMLFVKSAGTTIKSGSPELDADRAGVALQGIIRSNKHRPAPWKLEMLRKARTAYFAAWKDKKSVALVCSHTPAYAEAFAQTKDKDTSFADAVFAMNDWLIELQYHEEPGSPRRHWNGGFRRYRDGVVEQSAPEISSSWCAESLAEACRVAKLSADLPRYERYERALMANLHFLMSLQYTGAKTQHFVEKFRPSILGAFHASHQDGNIRIDYTQHSLSAMVQYLDAVVE